MSNSEFKVGSSLQLGEVTYTIIGVDTYRLINPQERKVCWSSYTLVDGAERLGLTLVHGQAILWTSVSSLAELEVGGLTLEFEKSGLASIEFQGDRGPSSPTAELLWFSRAHPEYPFAAIERFLHIHDNQIRQLSTFFYVGRRVHPAPTLPVIVPAR